MRINVQISSTGLCSRREADRLIAAGRVTINGAKATIGTEVGPDDIVLVDGRPLRQEHPIVYIAYHKPTGVESTTDTAKKANIVAAVGHPERIFPVGRLDKDTTGLILLTNDGQIVNRILRAENAHEKEYVVQVDPAVDDGFLAAMAAGVEIYNPVRHERTRTLPCQVVAIDARTFRIVLTQGLNLQIRRMCEALGRHVVSLRRIRIMNIELGALPVGRWRDLTPAERAGLLKLL